LLYNPSTTRHFDCALRAPLSAGELFRYEANKIKMESRKAITKRNIGFSFLLLLALSLLWLVISKPFMAHRLVTKAFTSYEVSQLKYPNSRLENKEIRATSKITMATHYVYSTGDDIDSVLVYLENELPGFEHLTGSRVINEPTYRNTICADETVFQRIFQFHDKGIPCIEVSVFPSDDINTSIRYSEKWTSMGFPSWLIRW
jgi:hypothetical protein